MIGPLEVVVVLLLALLFFGYKWLPQIGRSSGKAVRTGTDKAKDLASKASDKADSVDTKQIARQAGEHMRDVRELKEAVTGTGSSKSESGKAAPAKSAPAKSEPASKTSKESS